MCVCVCVCVCVVKDIYWPGGMGTVSVFVIYSSIPGREEQWACVIREKKAKKCFFTKISDRLKTQVTLLCRLKSYTAQMDGRIGAQS